MSNEPSLEQTLDYLKTSLLVNPHDPYKRFQLGMTYWKLGKIAEAVNAFKRDDPDILYALGASYAKAGEWQKSFEALRGVVRQRPGEVGAWKILAEDHTQLGNFDDAIEAHRKALSLEPAYVRAHVHIARLFERMQKWSAAADEYKEALKVLADDAELQAALATVLFKIERFDDCAERWKKALKLRG